MNDQSQDSDPAGAPWIGVAATNLQPLACREVAATPIQLLDINTYTNTYPERERERERLPLANTSITYSIICLYTVVGCQKGQSPSKLATHCSKQHNNTQ